MFDAGFGTFIAFSLLGPILLLGVIVLAITVVAGGKDHDPTGLRVRAVYLVSTCFVALFIVVGSVFALVTSIVDLIGESDERHGISIERRAPFEEDDFRFDDREERFGFAEDDHRTENAVSGAVMAALVGLAAGAVFVFHQRRMEELIAAPGFAVGPFRRPIQAYHYAVAFVAAFTALAAAAAAAYALYRIALPDYSAPDGHNERTKGARQLLSAAALLAVTGWLFLRHFERPRLWEAEVPPVANTSEPPPPPEIDLQP